MVNFLVFEIIIPVSVTFYISCIFQNCIMLQKYGTMMISIITTYRKSFSVEGYRYIKPIFIYKMAKKNEYLNQAPRIMKQKLYTQSYIWLQTLTKLKSYEKCVLIYCCKLQILFVILWTIWNCFMIIRLEPTKFSYNKK